jgi:hypothetical protein
LLRVWKLPCAARRDKTGEALIRIFPAHVEENVAFPGLMKAIHSSRYRCCFANVFGRFTKAKKVRVTGYVLWDDDHNGSADVGSTVEYFSRNGFHHPWRSTAWEIHSIIRFSGKWHSC